VKKIKNIFSRGGLTLRHKASMIISG
jgi:hypothetical protein